VTYITELSNPTLVQQVENGFGDEKLLDGEWNNLSLGVQNSTFTNFLRVWYTGQNFQVHKI
jgi:hypothetical protein